MKKSTSFRLSERALTLLQMLVDALGVSQASIVEMGIREIAKKHGIKEP